MLLRSVSAVRLKSHTQLHYQVDAKLRMLNAYWSKPFSLFGWKKQAGGRIIGLISLFSFGLARY